MAGQRALDLHRQRVPHRPGRPGRAPGDRPRDPDALGWRASPRPRPRRLRRGVPAGPGLAGPGTAAPTAPAPRTHCAVRGVVPKRGNVGGTRYRQGMTPLALTDRYGRTATDLRVSLTDRCNLRCTYCMPAEGLAWLPKDELLSDEELVRVIGVAVTLGVT